SPAYGKSLSIVKSLGDPATLNLDGGPVVITTTTDPATMTSASTTIGSSVTLASDSLMVMNVNSGTVSNSGTITSSAPIPAINLSVSATVNAATIIIESLNGSLTLAGNGSGHIVTTGSGTMNRPGSGGSIGPGILVSAFGASAV